MTRNFTRIFLITGLSAMLGSLTLNAQNLQAVAKIPFAFRSEGRVLVPGVYRIKEQTTSGIFQMHSEKHSFFVATSLVGDNNPGSGKLTFACYGSECVLTKIALAGSDRSFAISQAAIERNLTHKLGLSAMISVPLVSGR